MPKAEYIGSSREGWEHTWLFYKYRGHEYSVIKHNNGYMDKSLKQQHKEAQERIDKEIAESAKPNVTPKYEDTAEYGFNLFWNYVEGKDNV